MLRGFMERFSEDLRKCNFDIAIPKLESIVKTISLEIGKTLGENKSIDSPYTFQINTRNGVRNLLTATVSYRQSGATGNFGIGLKPNDNVQPELEDGEFVTRLIDVMLNQYHIRIAREHFETFLEQFFVSLFDYVLENSEDEEVVLDFNNYITCKAKDGKIALVAGSEMKKLIKSDATIEETVASEE